MTAQGKFRARGTIISYTRSEPNQQLTTCKQCNWQQKYTYVNKHREVPSPKKGFLGQCPNQWVGCGGRLTFLKFSNQFCLPGNTMKYIIHGDQVQVFYDFSVTD